MLLICSASVSGCNLVEKTQGWLAPTRQNVNTTIIEEKKVSISCKKSDINDFLVDGWSIKNEVKREIPCTWKVKKAKRGCDLNKDKGCRITVPDKMGKQIQYQLERSKALSK